MQTSLRQMAKDNVALSTQSDEKVESFLYPIRISIIVLTLQIKGPKGVKKCPMHVYITGMPKLTLPIFF